MQQDYQGRPEIQDAQKVIPVQVIQRPVQQHGRRMGSKLLHGDDFASKEDNTATEVDEINMWSETTTEDPIEAEMLAEVNEVYHKYGRYPSHRRYWNTGPRSQNPRALFRGG